VGRGDRDVTSFRLDTSRRIRSSRDRVLSGIRAATSLLVPQSVVILVRTRVVRRVVIAAPASGRVSDAHKEWKRRGVVATT